MNETTAVCAVAVAVAVAVLQTRDEFPPSVGDRPREREREYYCSGTFPMALYE